MLLAAIDPLFFNDRLSPELISVYAIILAAACGIAGNTRLNKKFFYRIIFFAGAVMLISGGEYIYSFFDPLWKGTNDSIYKRDEYELYGSVFMLAGIGLLFFGKIISRDVSGGPEKRDDFNLSIEVPALAVLVALAAALRLYNITEIPPGIWFDEAQNGNEVLAILEGGPLEVFIPRQTQMPAMFFYIAAFFMKVFGVDIFSLRMVSAVMGTLSVAAFYFLARYIFRDWKIAFMAALMMAFSRWHITFSRVAFLGMQTVLIEIIFFYFYIKVIREGGRINTAAAGFTLGLSQYTYSAAYFLIPLVMAHMAALFITRRRNFRGARFAAILAVAFIVLLPLIDYGISNRAEFFKRAGDVSITNEIKKKKSIVPVFKNIKTHLLMFNFEGDYNGRHNLYKEPLLAPLSGVLFAAGLVLAVFSAGSSVFFVWFFFMLLGGILTITIEAPQAYRIIGIIPVIYIFIGYALEEIKILYGKIINKRRFLYILFAVIAAASLVINARQYFVLYPSNQGTFMSFSPVSNSIAGFVNEKSDDYYILTSRAKNMYGFYMWEQSVVCRFATYGRGSYRIMRKENKIKKEELEGKKGVAVLLRPSDVGMIKRMDNEYGALKKKVYKHPLYYLKESGEETDVMFIAYYIPREKIKKGGDEEKYIVYR